MAVDHPFDHLLEGIKGDYRWAGPSGECMCGSTMFAILTVFDPDTRLPGFFLTDGMCVSCNALVRVPTPVDTWPDGTPMLALGPMTVPVSIDLTCPQCGKDGNTVVVDDSDGMVLAICESKYCQPIPFNAARVM